MLQTEKVPSGMMEILCRINDDAMCQDFVLAGGTAMALQIGHRLSEDLDFFTKTKFDPIKIFERLSHLFGASLQEEHQFNKTGLVCGINGIKVEFYNWGYQPAHHVVEDARWRGVRLARLDAIGAMKLQAIGDPFMSRSAPKDYYDMSFILQRVSLDEIKSQYVVYYPTYYFESVLQLTLGKMEKNDMTKEFKSMFGADYSIHKSICVGAIQKYMKMGKEKNSEDNEMDFGIGA